MQSHTTNDSMTLTPFHVNNFTLSRHSNIMVHGPKLEKLIIMNETKQQWQCSLIFIIYVYFLVIATVIWTHMIDCKFSAVACSICRRMSAEVKSYTQHNCHAIYIA